MVIHHSIPATSGLKAPLALLGLAFEGLLLAIVNDLASTEVVTLAGGVGVWERSGGGALPGRGGGVGVWERYSSWGSMAGTADTRSLPGIGWLLNTHKSLGEYI